VLDRTGLVRLLFMGGRGIEAVTRQKSEPNWIGYLGVQFLLGPKESSERVELFQSISVLTRLWRLNDESSCKK